MRELKRDPTSWSCLEVVFDLEGSGKTYETAENLALFPENSPETVERLARTLGYDLDATFVFKRREDA